MKTIHGHKISDAADILGVSRQIVANVVSGKRVEPKAWAKRLATRPVQAPDTTDPSQNPPQPPDPPQKAVAASYEPIVYSGKTRPTRNTAVMIESPDGDRAFDILGDGYARGFPGDKLGIRMSYRTPNALMRILEKKYNISNVSFPGMGDLPNVYKINSDGRPVSATTGELLPFNDKPYYGAANPK